MSFEQQMALTGTEEYGPEDYDEQGLFLYPGDGSDALHEGNFARLLATYLLEKRYRQLGIEEYYWFNPDSVVLTALRLHPDTRRYRSVSPDADGLIASPGLGLQVGIEGDRIGLYQDGVYVRPTNEMLTDLEQQLANSEQQRATNQARIQEAEARIRELERRLAERDES